MKDGKEGTSYSFRGYVKARRPTRSCAHLPPMLPEIKMEKEGCDKDSLMKGVHEGE